MIWFPRSFFLYGICMGFSFLAGDFHFLNTMHENEAMAAHGRTNGA